MKPHKYADIIKAWADGAAVQYYNCGEWVTSEEPSFDDRYEWRIKPAAKKYRVALMKSIHHDINHKPILYPTVAYGRDLEVYPTWSSFVCWLDEEKEYAA